MLTPQCGVVADQPGAGGYGGGFGGELPGELGAAVAACTRAVGRLEAAAVAVRRGEVAGLPRVGLGGARQGAR